jgi:beta-hydroxylase
METTPGQRRSVRDALGYLFRRAVFWFGFYIRPPIHWFIGRFSKVGNPPVFDPDVFAWTPELARNWEAIRDEALAVLENPADVPPLRTV